MAFRLQSSAPELMDLKQESKETLDHYGADPAKPSFARACLLARRMIERGVRFVNIYHEGWDAHSDVVGNHKSNCRATDQASAVSNMAARRIRRSETSSPESVAAIRPWRMTLTRSATCTSSARSLE